MQLPPRPPPSEVPAPHYAPELDVFGSHWAWVPMFERWVAVYRRIPPYKGPWRTLDELARRTGTSTAHIRAASRGFRVDGWGVEHREATAADRVRLGLVDEELFRIVHEQPQEAEVTAIDIEPVDLSEWTTAATLAERLGVTNSKPTATVNSAGARNGMCEGHRIERREATPEEREALGMSGPSKFVYRVEPVAEVEERGAEALRKARDREEHDPLLEEAKRRLGERSGDATCANCQSLQDELLALRGEVEELAALGCAEEERLVELRGERDRLRDEVEQLEAREMEREHQTHAECATCGATAHLVVHGHCAPCATRYIEATYVGECSGCHETTVLHVRGLCGCCGEKLIDDLYEQIEDRECAEPVNAGEYEALRQLTQLREAVWGIARGCDQPYEAAIEALHVSYEGGA